MVSIRVSALLDVSYANDTDMLARIRWMEGLVVGQPSPANQARLLMYIEWLKTSDVNPPD